MGARIRACDLLLSDVGMQAQIVDFKIALRTRRERHCYDVPYSAKVADRPQCLLARVLHPSRMARRESNALLFANPADAPARRLFHFVALDTSRWLANLRAVVHLLSPLDGLYKGHSIRLRHRRTP